MKIKTLVLLPLLLAVSFMSLVSCSTDETYETTLNLDDCLVTSASLGTIYRIVSTKTSTGADSTYRITVDGSLYPLSIDQIEGRIFNPDSLPVGTDVSRVVFSGFNATGDVSILSLDGKRDTTFVLTDSTDLRSPRYLKVYSYNGESKRTYEMRLNVHQEEADSFVWRNESVGAEALMGLEGEPRLMRRADGTLLVFGLRQGMPVVLVAACNTATGGLSTDGWQTTSLPTGFKIMSVCSNTARSTYYALAATGLLVSSDGVDWQPVGGNSAPEVLVGAGTTLLVGMKDGLFCSSADGGVTWTVDAADEAELLPQTSVRMSVVPSLTDPKLEDFVVVGLREGAETVVWRRTVDMSGHYVFGWYYLPGAVGGAGACPVLEEATLMSYDGGTLMVGLKSSQQSAALYMSRDNGRTWQQGEITLPVMSASTNWSHISATVDAENYLWLLESASGSLWRGRYNRMGWADYSGRFERSKKK